MFKKIFLLFSFILLVGTVFAWTPTGEINLRDYYDIINGRNASFQCIGIDGEYKCSWPGASNPFDQELNTTNDVKFQNLNLTGNATSSNFFGWLNWSWLQNIPSYIKDWSFKLNETDQRFNETDWVIAQSYLTSFTESDPLAYNGSLRLTSNHSFLNTTSYFSGNVGINTTSPNASLHVIGNTTNSAFFMNGNVGIGTTAPEEELHVVGDAKITGFVYSDTCPENMAYISKVGGFCIDKYEASTPGCEVVGNNCGSYQHANYCPSYCTPDNGVFGSVSSDTGTTAAAYSKVNVAPLVGVSQQQARQMCANVGKRLCTDEEWLAAANLQGKVYYLPATLSASPYDCVVDSTEYCSYFISNHACNTSYNKNGVSGCYSSEDVYDMVGNVWEWTNTTVDVINPEGSAASGTGTAGWYYANAQSQWQDSTTGLWTKYGNDGTYFPTTSSSTRAVLRGGLWDYGARAGLFCARLNYAPSSVYSYVGFRCCSSS